MESSRFGVNASYVESLRAQWMQDPSSVAEEWSRFFADEGGSAVSAVLSNHGSNGGHAQATPVSTPVSTSMPRNAESVLPQAMTQVVERIEVRERRSTPIVPAATDKLEILRGIAADRGMPRRGCGQQQQQQQQQCKRQRQRCGLPECVRVRHPPRRVRQWVGVW